MINVDSTNKNLDKLKKTGIKIISVVLLQQKTPYFIGFFKLYIYSNFRVLVAKFLYLNGIF